MRMPYGKTTAGANWGYAHPAWYANRGYVVVIQDVRGRYASDGEFTPFVGEAEDGYDAVEWAAGLPGSNGSVGMYGFSYPGATQLLAATLRPPEPGCDRPWLHVFAVLRRLGLRRRRVFARVDVGLGDLSRSRHGPTQRRRGGACGAARRARRHSASVLEAAVAGVPPAAGRACSVLRRLARALDVRRLLAALEGYRRGLQPPRVAGLHIGGWYDIVLPGPLVKNFRADRDRQSGRKQKLVIGPVVPQRLGARAMAGQSRGRRVGRLAPAVDHWQLRWFDYFLKEDEELGGDRRRRGLVYVLGEGWRDFDAWPPAIAQKQRPDYLHSGGSANSVAGRRCPRVRRDREMSRPTCSSTTRSTLQGTSHGWALLLRADCPPRGPRRARRTPETSKTMLVYTTAPLERDALVLIGDVSVDPLRGKLAGGRHRLRRAPVRRRRGRLTRRNLQEGIVRARFRDSLSEPTPITPGQAYRYEIGLGPVGVRVRAGECLRVDVASSDFPQWDRNLNTGGAFGSESASVAVVATNAVYHDATRPSRLRLPVQRRDT